MRDLLVQLLIATVQVILICLAVKFLPSYCSQKGKNLATKEDVAGITQQIEEVKMAYKDQYDLSKSERDLYDKTIETIYGFLAEIKMYEFDNNVALTTEVIKTDEKIRNNYFRFKDSMDLFVGKCYVFLREENYLSLKNAINSTRNMADLANNLLDAMRKSLYPKTQLTPGGDLKEFKYDK